MTVSENSGLLGRVAFNGRADVGNDESGQWQSWQRLAGAGFWLNWRLPMFRHEDETGALLLSGSQFGNDANSDAAEAVAAWWNSYRHQGDSALEQLKGSFLAIMINRQQQTCTLAVDRFATIPLYYAADAEGVSLASRLPLLRHTAAASPRLSMQAIYHYLYFHMVPSPLTVWEGVQKIPAGHLLKIDHGAARVERYWQPQFLSPAAGSALLRNQQAAAEQLVQRLTTAVERVSADNPATFLSGGLDSSTVTGLLSRQRDGDLDAYTVGFDATGYDEMPYARLAARHFGVRHHELYLQPADVVEIVPKIATAYDEPFGNSSAVPTYFCAAAAAAAGHGTILAGDGGDELFAGNARYAKQKLFEHYALLPAWLRAEAEKGVDRLPMAGRVPLIQKGYRYIEQARVPLPDRLESYNFFATHDPAQTLHPDLLGAIDLNQPLQLLRETYQSAAADHSLQRMLWLDWKQTLADNDLRKVTVMSQAAGIGVRYPMLDEDLIELALQIPPDWLLPGQKLRHFYKQAFREFLPEQIINKPKHGFGLPFGVWMRDHPKLRELAYDALTSLKKRDLLLPDYLDRVIHLHQYEHAAYYGDSIWIYMMLELWLQAWYD